MNRRAVAFILINCCLPKLGAAIASSGTVVDLRKVAVGNDCDVSRGFDVDQVAWIDEQRLVALRISSCGGHDGKVRKDAKELISFDTNGRVHTTAIENAFAVIPEPVAGVLIGHGDEVHLTDADLNIRQILKCPTGGKACTIFVSPEKSVKADFALCSVVSLVETCDFYTAQSGNQFPDHRSSLSLTAPYAHSPYDDLFLSVPDRRLVYDQTAWAVTRTEVWYFDKQGLLASIDSQGSIATVTTEDWKPKEGGCAGELSATEPRRFLATCIGTHWYTDGELDAIFGYSRIALFDVASRRIVARINGNAYTAAALSPSGTQIAVTHHARVRFYRVP